MGESPLLTEGIGVDEPSTGKLTAVVLEVVDGAAKGKRLRVKAGTVRVGSDPDCDLVIADKGISRRHATLELLPGSLQVKDLGSRNGTYFLGARIQDARVPIGSTLRFGLSLVRVLPDLPRPRASEREELHGLLGKSLEMRRVFALIERAGRSDATVLVRGETGTGKDGVARALHAESKRADRPFVVFDCAAVSGQLLESALFGHVKGAFTGADATRAGAVEEADGGTLFLDEIGELPGPLQAKFLRLLEAREFTRVGEVKPKHVDLRVVAATHRDLELAVKDGQFRRDLYFRLAVVVLDVPALRERREDIPLLVDSFARKLTGKPLPLSRSTLASFEASDWPGNVRELRNAVERAVTLDRADDEPGAGDDGEPEGALEPGAEGYKAERDALIARFERDYLKALLSRHRDNVSAAAREAKLSRSQFYRLLVRCGLMTERPD